MFDTAEKAGFAAAEIILSRLARAHRSGRPFLLGCPGGRSGTTTYRALGRMAAERRLDLGQLILVMMDDYLVEDATGSLIHEDASALHSCIRFGREEIVSVLSVGVPAGRRIAADHLWFPDPRDPAEYDRRIGAAGGIDLFLLASGAGDGHVAFNAPGAPSGSRTRIVTLPDSTRRDNLATFPSFGGDLARVPRFGVTVGIETIRSLSKSVILLLLGADKRRAAARLTNVHRYQADWPASVFADCQNPRLFLDAAAVPTEVDLAHWDNRRR